jgi:DNA-binding NtrC family response regulator
MDPRTIMIIDDDPDVRVSLFDLLRSEGYGVTTFENPYAALARVHEIRPDLVILDVRMPQVNGIDFLPGLKAAAPGVPVLILTAYANFDLFRQARESGACDMMCKPFSPRILLATLDRIFGSNKTASGISRETGP